MPQEHERGAGGWHAEWRPFRDLLETVGSAAAWARDGLEHTEVDVSRMRANMELTHGLLLAESVAVALAPAIGGSAARDLVARAAADAEASGRTFLDVLAADADVTAVLSPAALAARLEPDAYLGSAGAFVDRALAARRTATRSSMSGAVEVFHVSDGPPDAPALVLLDSLGSSLAMWDPQVEAFARHFRVVRFDLRGHGRSPAPAGPYEIADLGADVLALLDRLGIERAHLCGLSLGGMTALWLAEQAPERVDRLVLCCTSARLEPSEAWTARAALVRAGGTEAVADAVVGRWFTPAYAASHPDLVARMRAMIAAIDAEGYASCCEAIAAMDLRPALASVRAPTLLIAGADDPAIGPDHSERIAASIEGRGSSSCPTPPTCPTSNSPTG